MGHELETLIDLIRYAASRFAAARLTFGHGHIAALDEAAQLVTGALHLPPDIPPHYGHARVTSDELTRVLGLIERRVIERVPVAYLIGEAWFAEMAFHSDARALVPRSPIAELITAGFEPWLGERRVSRALDLCTGSGCIAIAMAAWNPDWQVDAVDISADALALAHENVARHGVGDRVRLIESDLFSALGDTRYELIVINPPYVPRADVRALPAEYHHEPALGLSAGDDGLDLALRILDDAPRFLTDDGLLIVEVGDSQPALEALLPDVPFVWIEFRVGQMGVFAIDAETLARHRDAIASRAAERRRGGT